MENLTKKFLDLCDGITDVNLKVSDLIETLSQMPAEDDQYIKTKLDHTRDGILCLKNQLGELAEALSSKRQLPRQTKVFYTSDNTSSSGKVAQRDFPSFLPLSVAVKPCEFFFCVQISNVRKK